MSQNISIHTNHPETHKHFLNFPSVGENFHVVQGNAGFQLIPNPFTLYSKIRVKLHTEDRSF